MTSGKDMRQGIPEALPTGSHGLEHWPPLWNGSRRRLLAAGLWGAVALLSSRRVSAASAVRTQPDSGLAFFTARERTLMAAVSPVILAYAMPADPTGRKQAVNTVLEGADYLLARISPPSQTDVHQAFMLMDNRAGRILLGGPWRSWDTAAPKDIAAFLNHLRTSGLSLKRRLFQLLFALSISGWYGHSLSWKAIGYPGPPDVVRPQEEENRT